MRLCVEVVLSILTTSTGLPAPPGRPDSGEASGPHRRRRASGVGVGVDVLTVGVADVADGRAPPGSLPAEEHARQHEGGTAAAAGRGRGHVTVGSHAGSFAVGGPRPLDAGPARERKPGRDQSPARPAGGVSSKSAVAGSGV